MKENKGLIIGTVVTIVVLLVLVLLISMNDKEEKLVLSNDPDVVIANAEKEAAEVKDSQKKAFKLITVDKYVEYYKGEKETLVYFTKRDCHNCELANNILQSIAKKYNIDINYIMIDDLDDEAYNAILESDSFMENNFGTPMLFLVGNNSIIDSVDGLTDRAHYIEFFKLNGYI